MDALVGGDGEPAGLVGSSVGCSGIALPFGWASRYASCFAFRRSARLAIFSSLPVRNRIGLLMRKRGASVLPKRTRLHLWKFQMDPVPKERGTVPGWCRQYYREAQAPFHNASGSYSATMEPRSDNEGDRRSWPRYPVAAPIEYRVIRGRCTATGQGKTINLSSGGVLFQSDQYVANGMRIELAIGWPVRLNDVAGLTLHVTGFTLRSQGKCAAVRILRREFRTRAVAGRPVVPLRTRY